MPEYEDRESSAAYSVGDDARYDDRHDVGDDVGDEERSRAGYGLAGAEPERVPSEAETVERGLGALSDQELLAGIRRSSEPHFSELYDRYFKRIYGFVHARVHNHADTEEIVQETFITVFRSIDNYRAQASLLSWMFGIAKNLTNNAFRKQQTQSAKLGAVDPDLLAPLPSVESCSPEQQYHLRCYGDAIRQQLGEVAEWQSEIFVMRHLENLSIKEIAARTHRSSDAVRSSLYRVKRLMLETAERGLDG